MRFTTALAHVPVLFFTASALPVIPNFQWPLGHHYTSPPYGPWHPAPFNETLETTPLPQGPLNQTSPDSTLPNSTFPANDTLPDLACQLPISNLTNSTSPSLEGDSNHTVSTLPWYPQNPANLTNPDSSGSATATNQTIDLDSHVEYSSSMGVLGCKVNTNRIAYFPLTPPCADPCIRLTAPDGNTIHVLHIDTSGGSYDVSMDAYKTLKYGQNWRTTNPGVEAKWAGVSYKYVSMSFCADILLEGNMPVIAKSPNKYIECVASSPQSVWATNVQFWDIDDARCLRGVDQKCVLREGENIPTCEDGKMVGYSRTPPLVGVPLVVDVTAEGVDVPAARPVV